MKQEVLLSYDFFWALFPLFMYKSISRSHNHRYRYRDYRRHRETLIVQIHWNCTLCEIIDVSSLFDVKPIFRINTMFRIIHQHNILQIISFQINMAQFSTLTNNNKSICSHSIDKNNENGIH